MKLIYITNIPAPYRQNRFNMMAKIFPEYGIDLEVLYMAKIEPNRKWIIPKDSYNYAFKIYRGIHPVIGGFFAHFNPSLLWRLLKKDYHVAIIGGMASPTHWLAPFFISRGILKIMSVESNLHSVTRRSGIGAVVKKLLLNKVDAFQVTGSPQIDYINYFIENDSERPFIVLPNLINEEIFINAVENLRIKKDDIRSSVGIDGKTQMWVLPARLIKIKGIIPFLRLLINMKGFKLFILGDGPQKKEIQNIVSQFSLNVELVGFIQQEELIRYYAAADLFILPSLKDPSPLSPIEATAAGLPLLVSNRIGNLEHVQGEKNGWSFDPSDSAEFNKSIIAKILLMTRRQLSEKGKFSLDRYRKFFDTKKCIHIYASEIKTLSKS